MNHPSSKRVLLIALAIAIAGGIGSLWMYLFSNVSAEWLQLVISVVMCVLVALAMIGAQVALVRIAHMTDRRAEHTPIRAYWRDLWDEMARFAGQQHEWHYPWLRTAYADGTPFRDGDPLFSAWSPSRRLGVRVIQTEPQGDEVELNYWHDVVGDRWTGEVQTLVISCALSKQAADAARGLILSWMIYAKASVSRPDPEELLVVSTLEDQDREVSEPVLA